MRRADDAAEEKRESEPALGSRVVKLRGHDINNGWIGSNPSKKKVGKTVEEMLVLVRELAAQPVPRSLHAASDTVLVGLGTRGRACAVLALASGLHLVDKVAGTTTANVVDGGLLRAEALLLLEFLVKAEHGTLLLAVHVAGAAATRGEEGVGRRCGQLDARCWARGGRAVGEVGSLDAGNVASTATAGVDVRVSDRWVRLGDVEGRHFGGGCLW